MNYNFKNILSNLSFLYKLNINFVNDLKVYIKKNLQSNINYEIFINLFNIQILKDIFKSDNELLSLIAKSAVKIHEYIQSDNLSIKELKKILYYIKDIDHSLFPFYLLETISIKFKNIKFNDCLVIDLIDLSEINIFNKCIIKKYITYLDVEKLSSKIVNKIDTYEYSNLTESKNLYYSIITQSNWVDELEYGNFMGLLINIIPSDLNKKGYNCEYIQINEITLTTIGFDQILEIYKNNEKKKNDYSPLISGFGIGNGNCILPLYISKDHWKIAEMYLNYNFGLMFNRNPLMYNNKHKFIYINVLFKMINQTFSNENYRSDKWINLLFSVLRTNYKLFNSDENINKFYDNVEYRVDCNLHQIYLEYLFSIDIINIQPIFEETIRRSLKNIYKNIDVLDTIYNFNTLEDMLFYEKNYKNLNKFDLINNNFDLWIMKLEKNKIFSEKITLIYSIIMMKKLIQKKIFQTFDQNGGILDDNQLSFIKDFIEKMIIKPNNYQLNGITNDKFKSHINYSKDKVFSIRTFKDINLVYDDIEIKSLFIQSLTQRVNKSRLNAIKNNKIQNPFENNSIIEDTGLLISQRLIKKYFNLKGNESYMTTLNLIDINLFKVFYDVMVSRTISVKKYIKNNITLLSNERHCILQD